MPGAYLLLDEPFDTDAETFFDRFLAAADAIGSSGADFVEDEQKVTPTQVMTRFLNEDGDDSITVWEDHVARLRYLEISTAKDAALQRALKAFREHFQTTEHEAVRGRISADTGGEARPENIFYQLAYSAPATADERTAKVIEDALRSPCSDQRSGAATACGVLGWPKLRAPLARALEQEQDPAVREAMASAMRVFGST